MGFGETGAVMTDRLPAIVADEIPVPGADAAGTAETTKEE